MKHLASELLHLLPRSRRLPTTRTPCHRLFSATLDSPPPPLRFADCEDLNPSTRKALAARGIEKLTPIQAETLAPLLQGDDVLARAKTGTGKTLGFLVPAIDRLYRSRHGKCPKTGLPNDKRTRVLVISPARELAIQIQTEAETLLKYHDGLSADCVYGGRKIGAEARRMAKSPPSVLVATPGRLADHLENTENFAKRLAGVETVILDECDNLLDAGFWESVRGILKHVPPPDQRQTMLFSATMDEKMTKTASEVLRKHHIIVDTAGAGGADGGTDDTVASVSHRAVVAPSAKQLEALMAEIVRVQASGPKHRAIIFFPTANATKFFARLFNHAGLNVLEMHSRLSQSKRQKVSDQFRRGYHPFLFSSDVSARGLDYPDVTHVLQVGIPSSKEQYLHRSGRTGRGVSGARGESILLLSSAEARYVLDDMLPNIDGLKTSVQAVAESEMLEHGPMLTKARASLRRAEPAVAEKAYQAYLGSQKDFIGSKKGGRRLGWSKERLVQEANAWSFEVLGLEKPPPLLARTVGKMGLKGTKGIQVSKG